MSRIIFFIIIIFFNNSVISSPIFETKFHYTEFRSNNIENDKLKKIQEIKIVSLKSILKKILIQKDFSKIENKLSNDLINYFIKNIIIENETIVENNYSSKVKIIFDKLKIVKYLREEKLLYIPLTIPNFVIVIYDENNFEKNLLTKNSQYYSYLIQNTDVLNNLLLPNLDINDRFILTSDDILNKNKISLNKFSKKYYNSDIIVLIVKKNKLNNNYNSYIYTNNKILINKNLNKNYNNFNELFDDLKNKSLDNWKYENGIQNFKVKKLNCDINYFNLLELKEIKKQISNTLIIEKIILNNLALKKNNYDILYYGNKNQLNKIFYFNNLNLKIIDDNCSISLI